MINKARTEKDIAELRLVDGPDSDLRGLTIPATDAEGKEPGWSENVKGIERRHHT